MAAFYELRQYKIQPGKMAEWLECMENEEQRVQLYKDVYESDFWKNTIAPRIPALLDRSGTVVQRIVPTSRSVAQ